jgi:hypothetical protein
MSDSKVRSEVRSEDRAAKMKTKGTKSARKVLESIKQASIGAPWDDYSELVDPLELPIDSPFLPYFSRHSHLYHSPHPRLPIDQCSSPKHEVWWLALNILAPFAGRR